MLSKCANPACSTPFIYLRDGKIFQSRPMRASGSESAEASRPEYFWLCGPCSEDFTLVYDPVCAAHVVWKKAKAKRSAA